MDATYELAVAAIEHLKQNAVLAAMVGSKIYDPVPEKQSPSGLIANVTCPYISMGPVTAISEDFDCHAGLEITMQFDAWSWGSGEAHGSAEVRKIAGSMRDDLHNSELTLETNALVTLTHELTRIMRDPDGITNHAALQFTAIVETP